MMKAVVNVLPYAKGQILMQLRDQKEGIVFPGCWGFFGGSIDEGEEPVEAARRELKEELNYEPSEIYFLDHGSIPDLGNLLFHTYYCHLNIPLEKIQVKEGLDAGLFTLKEIESRFLYSKRLRRPMPVIQTQYIPEIIEKLFDEVGNVAGIKKR